MMIRAAVIAGVLSTCAVAQTETRRPLFEASVASAPPQMISAQTLRVRTIEPDLGAVMSLDAGDSVTLDLFDDLSVRGDVTRVSVRNDGDVTVFGTIEGAEPGSFVLVAEEGLVTGRIDAADRGLYELRAHDDGYSVVLALDPGAFPGCGNGPEHDVKLPNNNNGGAGVRMDPCEEDGSVIDVLVLYTPAARSAAGGTNAIQSLAQSAIDSSNDAYDNSQIGPLALNLVHVAETPYTEFSSFSGHLNLLTNMGDGQMEEAHTLREQYQADLVALLVADTEFCGVAWRMTTNSTGFAPNGFSVTSVFCAVGNLTFAHELGHNMSCTHDRDNAGASLYAYGYGHRFNGTNGTLYRTVMAYSPGARRPYFSNPDVNYIGTPTGVPIGQPTQAHNAQAIDNTRMTIANFRNNCSDCNNNLVGDVTDINNGTSQDCNGNLIPDECEIADGSVTDCNSNGVPDECETPDCNNNGLPDSCDLASGFSLDCNGNGVPDECDAPDCNGNGVPDECEIATGAVEDCNQNAIPDPCDLVAQAYGSVSAPMSPIDFGVSLDWTIQNAPEADSDVTLDFEASGDLSDSNERLTVFLNGLVVGFLYETTGTDCAQTPDQDQLVVSASAWNAARQPDGSVTLMFSPNSAVSASQCLGGSSLTGTASYMATPVSDDADMNGVPDECVTGACSEADITTTGAGSGDPGFGTPDGSVTAADLNFYINLWVASDSGADITTAGAGSGDPGFGVPDGQVTAADLNYYVNVWTLGCP